MDKILVVGGAGYIGGAITDELLKKDIDLLVYDNLMYEKDFRKKVPLVLGDIRDREKLKSTIKSYNPTAIVWLAALVGDGACQVNKKISTELNEDSVAWLVENYDGRIVFPSTCSVYGKQDMLLSEESETTPLSHYAVTKLNAEKYLKKKNAVVFRLGTLFGISDEFSRIRLDLVVNILSLKAALNQPLTIFGGDQWRPLLHVRDAAKAIVGAAIDLGEENLPPGIYNLAMKNSEIKDLAEEIKNHPLADPELEITYTEMAFEDARNYRVSCSKYQSTKGSVAFNRSVSEGISEVITLVKEGRLKNPNDPIFYNERYLGETLERAEPELIKGDFAVDDRGSISFINDFSFPMVKRFYSIKNCSKDVVRAFHGHLKEGKYALATSGSFLLLCTKIDKNGIPSKEREVLRFVLSEKKPSILRIPPGYANGFKALEENSQIIFFSTKTVKESEGDDYRFNWDFFGREIWQSENR